MKGDERRERDAYRRHQRKGGMGAQSGAVGSTTVTNHYAHHPMRNETLRTPPIAPKPVSGSCVLAAPSFVRSIAAARTQLEKP